MKSEFRLPLDAGAIKAKALALGVDLVGIANGKNLEMFPDPDNPQRPSDITEFDAERVIVLAKRYTTGTTRLTRWDERHKYYNDELTLTKLEEASLDMVYWLEEYGYPAVIIPPTHVDPWRYRNDPGQHLHTLLSLTHAAVEAGLGTLGLNLQLLTPEFGPRVMLSAILCSVECETDSRRLDALCRGPECGRCLSTCPGDVVQHWGRDWNACDRFRSPNGFAQLTKHLHDIFDEGDLDKKISLLRSEKSFNLWQSILRGAGVITGCRRCQDVCPVGADYAQLQDALEVIPEDTPAKAERLAGMIGREATGDMPESFRRQERWIGKLAK